MPKRKHRAIRTLSPQNWPIAAEVQAAVARYLIEENSPKIPVCGGCHAQSITPDLVIFVGSDVDTQRSDEVELTGELPQDVEGIAYNIRRIRHQGHLHRPRRLERCRLRRGQSSFNKQSRRGDLCNLPSRPQVHDQHNEHSGWPRRVQRSSRFLPIIWPYKASHFASLVSRTISSSSSPLF